MHSPSEHTSTLLLERAGDGACLVPDDVSTIGPFRRDDRGPGDDRSPGPGRGPGPEQLVGRPAGQDQLLASPGMALLAAVSILEGYKWLGAIPAGDSRLSALVFGRGGALVFTALATVAAVVLTRADAGGPRTLPQRLVLLATAALIASSARASGQHRHPGQGPDRGLGPGAGIGAGRSALRR